MRHSAPRTRPAPPPAAVPRRPAEREPRLAPLSELTGVRLTRIPDVRGWPVELDDGLAVGRVERVWLDRSDREPRYFDVRINGRQFPEYGGRSWHVLVPVGRARLEAGRDVVRLPGLSRARVPEIPDTPPLGLTRPAERLVLRWFRARPAEGDDVLYAGEAFKVGALMADRWAPRRKG